MSNTAIKWALGQPVSKSSAKFVLVVMADLADDDEMTCYPSIAHLAKSTGQDVKTVQSGLHRLRQEGYIADTGKRCGLTGQVIVYRLNTPAFGGVQPLGKTPEISSNTPKNGSAESDQKTPGFPCNTSENGGVSSESKTTAFPDKTPVFPVKDPQISLETPPKTGDEHIKDTSRTHQYTPKRRAGFDASIVDLPDWLERDVWCLWARDRKARGKPMTEDGARLSIRSLEKLRGLGHEPQDVIENAIANAWQGLYAPKTQPAAKHKTSSHAGLASQKYSSGVNADGTFA